ncbi:MAG: mechanosensitive ion channel domain-containing protein [Actinomycetota bacterium]
MSGADAITFASFVDDHDSEINAAIIVLAALVFAKLVDKALQKRGKLVSEAMGGRALSAAASTRLRLVRRLVLALIVLIGIAGGLAQFPAVASLAKGVLASSAVLGLVVGFAARQTLANAIAGIQLAISQPVRVEDLVTFEEETGVVEDVRLSYTVVRLDDGRRLIVPNERLVQSPIFNHTVVDPAVQVEISVWLAPGGDATRALELLSTQDGVEARVAEVTHEGIRIAVTEWAPSARERGPLASRLRKESLQCLRDASLSSDVAG